MSMRPRDLTDPNSGDSTEFPSDVESGDAVLTIDSSKVPLGKVKSGYQIPTDFGTPDAPKIYIAEDINIIFKSTKTDLIRYNDLLMKAVPGFRPMSVGNPMDTKLQSAFLKALTAINIINQGANSPIAGKSLDESLVYLSKNPVISGNVGSIPTYRLNDPDTLKKAFEGGAQSALGRTLSEQEMNKLVNSFNQLDMNYQRAASAGGIVTQPPNAEVFAETQAEKMAPVEAESYDYMNYMGALSKWMQG
jgi:hypothetical protein